MKIVEDDKNNMCFLIRIIMYLCAYIFVFNIKDTVSYDSKGIVDFSNSIKIWILIIGIPFFINNISYILNTFVNREQMVKMNLCCSIIQIICLLLLVIRVINIDIIEAENNYSNNIISYCYKIIVVVVFILISLIINCINDISIIYKKNYVYELFSESIVKSNRLTKILIAINWIMIVTLGIIYIDLTWENLLVVHKSYIEWNDIVVELIKNITIFMLPFGTFFAIYVHKFIKERKYLMTLVIYFLFRIIIKNILYHSYRNVFSLYGTGSWCNIDEICFWVIDCIICILFIASLWEYLFVGIIKKKNITEITKKFVPLFICILVFSVIGVINNNYIKKGTYYSNDKKSMIHIGDEGIMWYVVDVAAESVPKGEYIIKDGLLIFKGDGNLEVIFEIKRGELVLKKNIDIGNLEMGTIYEWEGI